VISFRTVLTSISIGCIASFLPVAVWAQQYPAKPVRLVVASSAGSNPDTVARIVAASLTNAFGQQVIVDNRAGAGGNIGAELAARAPADGYTLFLAHTNHTINPTLYRALTYDLLKDFSPVTLLALAPYIASLHPSIPARTLRDLIRLAKARPRDVLYSSAGLGSGSFFAAEYLKAMAKVEMLHVPYKGGGPAIAAVVAGETSVCFMPVSVGMPHYQHGRLRPLAVSSAQRLTQLPQVPTIAETVPGYEMVGWTGLMVPAKTPKDVGEIVHKAVMSAVNAPDVQKRLDAVGYMVAAGQPEAMQTYLKRDIETYAELIRRLDLPLQ
jgi:tripartite-type tricarboxylate transporter receptor subunit TctC